MKTESFDQATKEFDNFWETHTAKPCPFCASENYTIYRRAGRYDTIYYFIKCETCGGSGGASAVMCAALEKWNTRRVEVALDA